MYLRVTDSKDICPFSDLALGIGLMNFSENEITDPVYKDRCRRVAGMPQRVFHICEQVSSYRITKKDK